MGRQERTWEPTAKGDTVLLSTLSSCPSYRTPPLPTTIPQAPSRISPGGRDRPLCSARSLRKKIHWSIHFSHSIQVFELYTLFDFFRKTIQKRKEKLTKHRVAHDTLASSIRPIQTLLLLKIIWILRVFYENINLCFFWKFKDQRQRPLISIWIPFVLTFFLVDIFPCFFSFFRMVNAAPRTASRPPDVSSML